MPADDAPRAVLVTGATGGIGRAATRALADRGFRVYAAARGAHREPPGHPNVHPITLDVTDPATVAAAVEQVRAHGGDRLYGLVNNAGLIVQGPCELVPAEELRRQFDVNVLGAMEVTRAFLPLLRDGRGRLVNITAATARVAGPYFGPVSASKAALQAFSDALRLELAHLGVRVVVVEPGAMRTEVFAKAEQAAETYLRGAPPEVMALYEAPYGAVARANAALNLSPPELVADAIVTALTRARPRPRYTVGPDVRLLPLLARLPLRTRDRLLGRALGLHKVPAA
jgi:NAD(P)-dependent dehydrogenase (short-subunit alcohol dehydrogenase family)